MTQSKLILEVKNIFQECKTKASFQKSLLNISPVISIVYIGRPISLILSSNNFLSPTTVIDKSSNFILDVAVSRICSRLILFIFFIFFREHVLQHFDNPSFFARFYQVLRDPALQIPFLLGRIHRFHWFYKVLWDSSPAQIHSFFHWVYKVCKIPHLLRHTLQLNFTTFGNQEFRPFHNILPQW